MIDFQLCAVFFIILMPEERRAAFVSAAATKLFIVSIELWKTMMTFSCFLTTMSGGDLIISVLLSLRLTAVLL